MKEIKKLADKKYFMTLVWIFLIIAVWEIFAFIVAATKRTPENILPHLSGIIESVISKRTINEGCKLRCLGQKYGCKDNCCNPYVYGIDEYKRIPRSYRTETVFTRFNEIVCGG